MLTYSYHLDFDHLDKFVDEALVLSNYQDFASMKGGFTIEYINQVEAKKRGIDILRV